MSEKYIDLADRIKRGHGDDEVREGIDYALKWLDGHPDQVPGRTITESRVKEKLLRRGIEFVNGWTAAMIELGATVVPDPEPTNAEKLADILGRYDLDAITDGGAAEFARQLDADGIKAPGGDDEH